MAEPTLIVLLSPEHVRLLTTLQESIDDLRAKFSIAMRNTETQITAVDLAFRDMVQKVDTKLASLDAKVAEEATKTDAVTAKLQHVSTSVDMEEKLTDMRVYVQNSLDEISAKSTRTLTAISETKESKI
jgi:Arc/MetJ family transcription regulator